MLHSYFQARSPRLFSSHYPSSNCLSWVLSLRIASWQGWVGVPPLWQKYSLEYTVNTYFQNIKYILIMHHVVTHPLLHDVQVTVLGILLLLLFVYISASTWISLWTVTLPMLLSTLLLIFTSSSTSASAVNRQSWSPCKPIRSLSTYKRNIGASVRRSSGLRSGGRLLAMT